MRTTLEIDDELLEEVKQLSGTKTKRDAIEAALAEYVRRRKARRLLDLKGSVELSTTLDELLKRRKKDVPYR